MNAPVIDINQLSKPEWNEFQRENANAVLSFVQTLMNEHNFDTIRHSYLKRQYKQHNQSMIDSIEGVTASLKQLTKSFPEFNYDVKRVYVDGDHVVLHSHATLKYSHRGDDSKGLNIVDIWKVDDGYLVEHWDAIQALSLSTRLIALFTGGQRKNENGVF
jgi:predicted SnoaL-like aldol condensation-catalyzing enzyme